jgi:hypothetical protein
MREQMKTHREKYQERARFMYMKKKQENQMKMNGNRIDSMAVLNAQSDEELKQESSINLGETDKEEETKREKERPKWKEPAAIEVGETKANKLRALANKKA